MTLRIRVLISLMLILTVYSPVIAASDETRHERCVTVAVSLQSGGDATAFFGMWNLGRGRTGPMTPGGQGFQKVVFPENLGFGKDEHFDDDKNYLSDRLTDEVLKFVDEHREQPFFAYQGLPGKNKGKKKDIKQRTPQ